jgi:proline dehydrogenase
MDSSFACNCFQQVSSACVKISAICPIDILERVSSLLWWQHVNKDFNLPWKQDVIPVLAEGSPTYHVQSPPQPLTEEEEKQLVLGHNRLTKLCQACESEGIPLLVDAEYFLIQPAVDYFINVAASRFNRGRGQPLVYGTMQTYLKDSFPRLSMAVKDSQHRGLSYGVKLVRGAYISRENALAAALGIPSPIHPDIEATHRCYNFCAAFMLEQAASGDGAVVLATHNMNSGE